MRQWVAALESTAPMRTNTGVPIRQQLELAMKVTKDKEVVKYLTRALKHYKGNAAGSTKFAAIWLAAQIRKRRYAETAVYL